LLVLGASEEHSKNPDVVFTPFVDYLVRLAPCPTMVVHGQRLQPNWQPRRVLVPTNGSTAAKHAAELALALTSAEEEIHILHVVAPNPFLTSGTEREEGLQEQINRGYQMVKPLQTLGEAQQRPVQVKVLVGRPETAIIEYAKEQEIDLIILGTDVRAGTDRLFLGSRVERILQNTPCPVVVFNS
jgi:nucleotide-binding universal stress UspA family protein